MKKLSIIIPVHNASKYLPYTLNSILNQTITNYEVIIVNDHSTDNSLEIIEAYQKQYPSIIKSFNLLEKKGVSCARNKGLELANGEYIGFVDADDIIVPNMYEDLIHFSNYLELPVAGASFKRIDALEHLTNEPIKPEKTTIEDIGKYSLIDYELNRTSFLDSPSMWNFIFNHDFIEDTKFLENHIFEDLAFTYPILLKAETYPFILKDYYFYRQTPKGIMDKTTNTKNKEILDIFAVSLHAQELANKFNFNDKKRALLEKKLTLHAFYKIKIITNWYQETYKKELLTDQLITLYDYAFSGWQEEIPVAKLHNELLSKSQLPKITSPTEEMKLKEDIKKLIRTV